MERYSEEDMKRDVLGLVEEVFFWLFTWLD